MPEKHPPRKVSINGALEVDGVPRNVDNALLANSNDVKTVVLTKVVAHNAGTTPLYRPTAVPASTVP